MQLLLLLAAWLLTGALMVKVTPVDGPAYQAELVGAQQSGLELIVDGQPRQVALADLQSVQRSEPDERGGPAIRVSLRDGTQLPIDEIVIAGEQAELKLRRQGTLTVPVRSLAVLRLRPPSGQIDAQWSALVGQLKPNDQLVIRRGPDTLDAVGGVVKSIDGEQVHFDLDGAPVDAPFNRLEGVIFGGRDAPAAAAGKIRVQDVLGAVWNASDLQAGSTEETMTVTTMGGHQHEIRIDLLRSIELASSVVFLASVEPLAQSYQPYIALPAELSPEDARTWLGRRIDQDRNLVVPSKSSLSYRIEPGFGRFVADVQIDPSVTLGGTTEVRVLLNDKIAWEQTLKIGEPAKKIELPISDASRLTLEVDYGGDGDVGDIVHIHEPRLLK